MTLLFQASCDVGIISSEKRRGDVVLAWHERPVISTRAPRGRRQRLYEAQMPFHSPSERRRE